MKKIPLILDKNNEIHMLYIELINYLYNKIKTYIESNGLNIEVINPILNNTLELEINSFKNNSTKFFEINNNNEVIAINIESISNRQFNIAPIFFLYHLTINHNKLYFNFILSECYIKYCKPSLPIPFILDLFSNDKKQNNKTIKKDDSYIF
jgi:hypothetical protein